MGSFDVACKSGVVRRIEDDKFSLNHFFIQGLVQFHGLVQTSIEVFCYSAQPFIVFD